MSRTLVRVTSRKVEKFKFVYGRRAYQHNLGFAKTKVITGGRKKRIAFLEQLSNRNDIDFIIPYVWRNGKWRKI